MLADIVKCNILPKLLNICLNINIIMAFKTLTIKESVYKKLLLMKKENESFSDLFERLSNTNLKVLRKMFVYGGWVSITNIISPLLVYVDRFLIGSLISMASVAFYTVPYEVIVRLRILPGAIMKTIFPEFSASSVYSETERVEILFVRSVKYILIIVGSLVVLLFVYAPSILQLWMGAEFVENSLDVFRILAIGVFVNYLHNHVNIWHYMAKHNIGCL